MLVDQVCGLPRQIDPELTAATGLGVVLDTCFHWVGQLPKDFDQCFGTAFCLIDEEMRSFEQVRKPNLLENEGLRHSSLVLACAAVVDKILETP